jgi:hypothetical protein
VDTELRALLVEVVSIGAAGQKLKKPITVPRPKHIKRKGGVQHADTVAAGPDPYKRGVAVLAATTRGAVHR